ncbi:serine hydrolase [Streptomyces sp. NPDC049813]|uniref:serine hydrolase n=1 Tax=Streptomyces sp. NPDC049813 TaxID=3365597 RepID=UPI0037A16D6E
MFLFATSTDPTERSPPGSRRSLGRVPGSPQERAAPSAVFLAATSGLTVDVGARPHDAAALVAKVTAAAAEEGPVSPSASAASSPSSDVDRDAALAVAVHSVAAGHAGEVSVAIFDEAAGTGAAYASGDGTYDTASIVKVDILAALLVRAQDEGRALTAQEKTHATAMIRTSDNAAATAVWDALGGTDGLNAANARLGLTGTTGGDGPLWGLTQTTAADQIVLLRQVFGAGDGVLSAASRAYVRELMGSVADDQAWGVSAAGPAGCELKNGWLRRSTTELWDINSIGRVRVAGARYLVAVLSHGSTTKEGGVALVEAVAKAAVAVVHGGG